MDQSNVVDTMDDCLCSDVVLLLTHCCLCYHCLCRLQQQSDWVQVQIQKEASAAFNLQRSRKMSKTFNIFSTHSTASHEAAGKVSSAQQHGSKDDSASHQLQPLTTLGAVELINAQFEGLIEGYAARVAAEWSADPVGGPARIGKLDRVHHTFMQNNGEPHLACHSLHEAAFCTHSTYVSCMMQMFYEVDQVHDI